MAEESDVEKLVGSIYREFAASQHQHVIDNPVCEICKDRPSVRITRFGPIRAACNACLTDEHDRFHEHLKNELENSDDEW